jgi:DNA segregation ATPase FtsK/SpoIIIE-like protein
MVQGRLVIDIQRRDRQFIDFAAIESQIPATDPLLGSAQVPLGIDLEGRLHCLDLADPDCAHVLVAGTTGSGKSEWLKCAVAGLISRNAPEQLLFLIIDPKRNAFLWMQHTPYLYKPIVFPDEAPVAEALAALADEMDRRYALLEGAPSLAEWSRNTGTVLPRIVCVCDEYADLVCRGKAEREATESQIVRLGAKARAAGIHLMIATQQPSRKIVDGALDTNIPARIGLKMQRSIESRMVLSESGAELLLGKGDLLFKNINPPQRFQSAYLPDDQRDALMDKCASGFS